MWGALVNPGTLAAAGRVALQIVAGALAYAAGWGSRDAADPVLEIVDAVDHVDVEAKTQSVEKFVRWLPYLVALGVASLFAFSLRGLLGRR